MHGSSKEALVGREASALLFARRDRSVAGVSDQTPTALQHFLLTVHALVGVSTEPDACVFKHAPHTHDLTVDEHGVL